MNINDFVPTQKNLEQAKHVKDIDQAIEILEAMRDNMLDKGIAMEEIVKTCRLAQPWYLAADGCMESVFQRWMKHSHEGVFGERQLARRMKEMTSRPDDEPKVETKETMTDSWSHGKDLI